jgi:hypothetical protein
MSRDDLLDDRQSETTPAGVTSAGLVEPHESVEDALPVLAWDPGAVVLDHELDAVIGLPDGEGHDSMCVPGSVVDEVLHHLRERNVVTPYPSGPDSGRMDGETGLLDTPGDRQRQVVEVDIVARPCERTFVGPGEEQQLFHEPLHARGLLENGIGELTLGQGTRVRARHLGRLANAGQR